MTRPASPRALASFAGFACWASLACVACAACGDRAGGSASGPAPAGSVPWRRDGAAHASSAHAPAPTSTVDPAALDEIVAATPTASAYGAGESRIGSPAASAPETSASASALASASASARPEPSASASASTAVTLGPVESSPIVPSATVEREARAQLYYKLTTRCTAVDGGLLPPDAITLRFKIDSGGYIVADTIDAEASSKAFEAARRCMVSELARATFRLPPSARGALAAAGAGVYVTMTVPSVD